MSAILPFLRQRATALLLVLIAVTALTAAFWQYTQDDVFITYTYSRNIAQGVGFVFNPGEYVQGTTTPLWALTIAGAYLITPDLLHAGNLLSGLLLVAVCLLAYQLLRAESRYAALAAALLMATSPLNYASFGMETLLYCALLFAAFLLWSKQRQTWAMLAAAALTWTRADGVVLAGTLCLLALLESGSTAQRLGRATRLGLIYVAGIAPWFLFARAYFGHWLPNTFGAKQELLQGIDFLSEGVARWRTFFGDNPLSLLALPFVPVGLWQAWRRPPLRPLAVWTLLYAFGYTALNVTNFWYYTPLVNALIALAALGGAAAARALPRRDRWRAAALAMLLAAALLNVARALQLAPPPLRMATYRLAGEWIAEQTPADATLLVADLGITGYYAERRALDSFGLIVPDMRVRTPEYATLKYKPDYILATQYFLWRYTAEDWFRALYRPIAQFTSEGDSEFSPMTLYQRRDALTNPDTALEGTALPLSFTLTFPTDERMPALTEAALEADGRQWATFAAPFLSGHFPVAPQTHEDTAIEQIHLPLPAAPGEYQWTISAPVTLEGSVEVTPLAASPDYAAAGAEWADWARLNGVLLRDTHVWAGGSVRALLDWAALGTPARDYTVFVHLRDETGALGAQHDGMPAGGQRPTSGWQAGERVIDAHELVLPHDVPPGSYELCLGWYDWETLERVPLSDGTDALCGIGVVSVRSP